MFKLRNKLIFKYALLSGGLSELERPYKVRHLLVILCQIKNLVILCQEITKTRVLKLGLVYVALLSVALYTHSRGH